MLTLIGRLEENEDSGNSLRMLLGGVKGNFFFFFILFFFSFVFFIIFVLLLTLLFCSFARFLFFCVCSGFVCERFDKGGFGFLRVVKFYGCFKVKKWFWWLRLI